MTQNTELIKLLRSFYQHHDETTCIFRPVCLDGENVDRDVQQQQLMDYQKLIKLSEDINREIGNNYIYNYRMYIRGETKNGVNKE